MLPDVPTISETVPGYEAVLWLGVGLPSGTPTAVTDMLAREINAALTDPRVNARLAELGAAPMVTNPSQFGAFVAAETERWEKVTEFGSCDPRWMSEIGT